MEFIACIEIKMKLQIESITLVYKKVDHLRHKKKTNFSVVYVEKLKNNNTKKEGKIA